MPKRAVLISSPADAGPAAASPGGVELPTVPHVIAIASDPALLELLRGSLQAQQRVWRADDLPAAAELLFAAPASVLLVDAAVTTHETPRLVEQVSQQFPGLPVLVTGRRDDETSLSALISSGAVFRFLHKPLSADRVRTFVDAAVRRLAEQPPTPSPVAPAPAPERSARPGGTTSPGRSWPLPVLLAAVAIVAVVAALAMRQPAEQRPPGVEAGRTAPPPPVVAPGNPAERGPTAAAAAPDPAVTALLSAAAVAVAQGRLVEPVDDSAVVLYRRALALDPANAEARGGLDQVAGMLLDAAEGQLAEGTLTEAAVALDAARAVSPQHPRLQAVSAALARARTQRAALPVAPAGVPAPPPVREGAAERDRRERFERALAAASDALARGEAAQATERLEQARGTGLDPDSVARLQAQVDALRAATERADRERLLALANQRLAQGRLLEADSARHYLDLLRAADPAFPGADQTAAMLGERLLADARGALAAGRPADALRLVAAAESGFAPAAETARLRADLALAEARARAAAEVLPESSLVRVRYAPPAYPQRAAARDIEGWVDVEFTVATDGSTRGARVLAASPPGAFDDAVLAAIANWRYQPRVIGGQPVEQRVALRLQFRLDGR